MFIKILAAVLYIVVLGVNALANILPINDKTTGQISDSYPNLFTPAGLTFSIWALIYFLLAVYVLYQFGLFQKKSSLPQESFLKKINLYFIATSIINILWIFSWHYQLIGLSVLLILLFLFSLIKIADAINKEPLTAKQKIFIAIPFSVYFGWISVASIANITIFLVDLGWNGFGLADYVWTVIVLLVGAAIGIMRMLKDKSLAYGLVFVWAYVGILIKHLSTGGFGGQYSSIITTLIICLILFLVFEGLLYKNKFAKK